MTTLTEKIVVTVTINHDKGPSGSVSTAYGGLMDLHALVKKIWPHLAPFGGFADNGTMSMAEGAVEIEWKSTGLYEEVEEGDN